MPPRRKFKKKANCSRMFQMQQKNKTLVAACRPRCCNHIKIILQALIIYSFFLYIYSAAFGLLFSAGASPRALCAPSLGGLRPLRPWAQPPKKKSPIWGYLIMVSITSILCSLVSIHRMSNDVVFSQVLSFFSLLIFSLASSFVLCKMELSQPSESRIV